jgi:hypothetical protein
MPRPQPCHRGGTLTSSASCGRIQSGGAFYRPFAMEHSDDFEDNASCNLGLRARGSGARRGRLRCGRGPDRTYRMGRAVRYCLSAQPRRRPHRVKSGGAKMSDPTGAGQHEHGAKKDELAQVSWRSECCEPDVTPAAIPNDQSERRLRFDPLGHQSGFTRPVALNLKTDRRSFTTLASSRRSVSLRHRHVRPNTTMVDVGAALRGSSDRPPPKPGRSSV